MLQAEHPLSQDQVPDGALPRPPRTSLACSTPASLFKLSSVSGCSGPSTLCLRSSVRRCIASASPHSSLVRQSTRARLARLVSVSGCSWPEHLLSKFKCLPMHCSRPPRSALGYQARRRGCSCCRAYLVAPARAPSVSSSSVSPVHFIGLLVFPLAAKYSGEIIHTGKRVGDARG